MQHLKVAILIKYIFYILILTLKALTYRNIIAVEVLIPQLCSLFLYTFQVNVI